MIYLAIDTETTGLNVQTDSILELGAMLVEYPVKDPDAARPVYTSFVDHKRVEGHPMALAINSRVLRLIAEGAGRAPSSVWSGFCHWMRVVVFKGRKPTRPITVAGKNVWKTDLPMILKAIVTHAPQYRDEAVEWFDHRSLDPAPYYFDPRKDAMLPSLSECCKRAGFAPDRFQFHTAIEDAEAVVALLHHAWDRDPGAHHVCDPCPQPAGQPGLRSA